MAYTAIVNSATVNAANGNVDVTATFSNGVRSVVRSFSAADLDDVRIKNLALITAEQLEAQDAANAGITLGAVAFR